MINIDFNTLFGDPLKNLSAARYALQRTEIGRSGLIRVDLDEAQKLSYTLITSGQRFGDYGEAFARASSEMITKFNIIKPLQRGAKGAVQVGLNSSFNPRTEQAAEFLTSINRRDVMSQLAGHREQLVRLGMSSEQVDELISGTRQIGMQLSQVKDQIDVRNYASDFIKRQLKKVGADNFFPFIDKDGANILKFTSFSTLPDGKAGTFTNAQIHYILNALGSPMLDTNKTLGLFDAKSIEDFLQKLPKRFKGMFSERDLTIVTQDVISALGEGKTLDNTTLIIEEGLDFLRSAMGIEARAEDVASAIAHADTKQIIRSSLVRQMKSQEAGLTPDELFSRANQLTETLFGETGSLREVLSTSQTNREFLERAGGILGDDPQLKMVKQLFEDAEKEFDGDAIINERVFNAARRRVRSQLENIRARIVGGETSEALEQTFQDLQRQVNVLENSDLYQITGRGFLAEGQPKFAAQIREISQNLSNKYSLIIGRSGMKGELGLGGDSLREIILSGFGRSKGVVYSDPNLIATHPEIFASEESLKAMKQNSQKVLQQMNEVISQDMLSPNMVRDLKAQLDIDFTGLPEPVRLAKERNKRFAEEILRLHEMGVGPKNSPMMMNHLANYFQTEMFTMEEGKYGTLFHPVLPNTQRFALSTETVHGSLRTGFKSILGDAKMKTTFSGLSEADEVFSRDLMRFRIHDKRLLFGGGAVPEFFNALGGFDLDDKGLPTMVRYRDQMNVERILFSIVRQPTAFQENIYARATLDQETLRQLFSKDKDFIKTITEMAQENESDNFLKYIKSSFEGTQSTLTGVDGNLLSDEIIEAEVEKRILSAYNKMGRSITSVYEDNGRILNQINKFGSTALTTKEFQRSNLQLIEQFKVENEDAFARAFPEIKEDLIKTIENYKNILTPEVHDQLSAAIRSDNSKRVTEILTSTTNEVDSIALASIREMSLVSRLSRGSEAADILGVYVNRSMVIASTLNQFDDFAGAFVGNDRVKNFLYGDGIKLVSSELAIDKATGFSLFKEFQGQVIKQINASVSSDAALGGVQRMMGLPRNLTVSQVGEEAIMEMGKRLGKMAGLQQTAVENTQARLGRNLSKQEADDLFPILDRFLLESKRLSEADQFTAAKGILAGLEETEQEFGTLSERATGIKRALQASITSQKKAIETLTEEFGRSTSRYASSSLVQRQTAEIARNTRANVKDESGKHKNESNNRSYSSFRRGNDRSSACHRKKQRQLTGSDKTKRTNKYRSI